MRCDWRKVEQDHNQDCLEIKRSVLVLVLVLCFLSILSLLPVFLRSFPSPVFPPPAARPLVRFVCIQAVVLHSVFVSSFLRSSRFSSSCFFFCSSCFYQFVLCFVLLLLVQTLCVFWILQLVFCSSSCVICFYNRVSKRSKLLIWQNKTNSAHLHEETFVNTLKTYYVDYIKGY